MRPALTGVLAALVLGAAWAGAPAAAKEKKMEGATAGKAVRVYAGRYSVEVPAEARYTGGEHSMQHYLLTEVAMPGRPEEAWQKTYGAKLGAIAEIKRRRMRPTWIDGEIHAQVELSPGPERFAAVLFHPDNDREGIDVAALRQVGAAGLWVERSACELDEKDAILKLVATLGRAWRPLPDGAARPKTDVFHLPGGVVALPAAGDESVMAHWKGGALGVEVTLATETTDEPRGGGLMARFGEALARAGAAYGAGASVVRNGGRKAAGLAGEEFVMRDSEEGKLYCLWEFKGEKGSGAKPEIQLQMITKDERQKEKLAAWDALVDSLRPAASP
jgi:hypothetical protein